VVVATLVRERRDGGADDARAGAGRAGAVRRRRALRPASNGWPKSVGWPMRRACSSASAMSTRGSAARRRPRSGASGAAPAIRRSTGCIARGVGQMESAAFDDALATFDEIVRRKPAFAEGWNKRATIYFLLGRFEASLHRLR
jgi:hypothetical protein